MTESNEPRLAAGYYRVSSESQTRGNSPEMQQQSIRSYADLYHYQIPPEAWFRDSGVSGRKGERAGLEAAVAWCVENRAVLICWDIDRYMRNTVAGLSIELRLRQAGAGLASVNQRIDTTTPEGVLMFTFFLAIAQYESDKIGRRVTDCMNVCRQNHKIVGEVPYGWERDMTRPETHRVRGTTYYPHLIEVPEQQQVIRDMMRPWYKEGVSLSEIARRLMEAQIPNRENGHWRHQQVARALGLRKSKS